MWSWCFVLYFRAKIYLFFHQENSHKRLIYHHVKVVKGNLHSTFNGEIRHTHTLSWSKREFIVPFAMTHIHIWVANQAIERKRWKAKLNVEMEILEKKTNEKWRSKTRCMYVCVCGAVCSVDDNWHITTIDYAEDWANFSHKIFTVQRTSIRHWWEYTIK